MKRTWENYTRFQMYSPNSQKYLDQIHSKAVLSVHILCLGNICRSPMATAVLTQLCADLKKPQVLVDSSGTGPWHVGEDATKFSSQVWQEAGYKYQHTAKQFKVDYFQKHDLILAMDLKNRAALFKLAKNDEEQSKIFMFTSFDPKKSQIDPDGPEGESLTVSDPYGKELVEYQKVLKVVEQAAAGFMQWVRS